MEIEVKEKKSFNEEVRIFHIDTTIFDRFEDIKASLSLISYESVTEKIQNFNNEINNIYEKNLSNNIQNVKYANSEETLYFLETDTFSFKKQNRIIITESALKSCTKNVNIENLENCTYKTEIKDKKNNKYVLLDASYDYVRIFYEIFMAYQPSIKYPKYYISETIKIENDYSEIKVLDISNIIIETFNINYPYKIEIPKYSDKEVLIAFLSKMFINFSDMNIIYLPL